MKPAKFKYVRAETAEHAVHLLGATDGAAKILAGGQSLIPALSARNVSASVLIDIMGCPRLNEVSETGGELRIGAACRQSQIERSAMAQQSAPLLCEALGWVAMPQVRSLGTVVGCLAQANPGAEVPVVSLALEAQLDLVSSGEPKQRIAARDFYTVETGTRLPLHSMIESASFRTIARGEGWGFCEVQLRQAHFALVCCATTMLLDEAARIRSATIAIGGLTTNPYRAERAEKALLGELADRDPFFRDASESAAAERPWPSRSDLHATAAFREKAAVTAVARALRDARARCSRQAGETHDAI